MFIYLILKLSRSFRLLTSPSCILIISPDKQQVLHLRTIIVIRVVCFYQGFFLCFQVDMMSWAGRRRRRRRRHRNTIIRDVKRA